MDDAEVAVQGQNDEEADAGPSIEEEHEVHQTANGIILTVPQIVLIVVNFNRNTDHHQKISNHNVEEEHTVILPEFVPEEETVYRTFSQEKQNIDLLQTFGSAFADDWLKLFWFLCSINNGKVSHVRKNDCYIFFIFA